MNTGYTTSGAAARIASITSGCKLSAMSWLMKGQDSAAPAIAPIIQPGMRSSGDQHRAAIRTESAAAQRVSASIEARIRGSSAKEAGVAAKAMSGG